jgi:hypothetical protein
VGQGARPRPGSLLDSGGFELQASRLVALSGLAFAAAGRVLAQTGAAHAQTIEVAVGVLSVSVAVRLVRRVHEKSMTARGYPRKLNRRERVK